MNVSSTTVSPLVSVNGSSTGSGSVGLAVGLTLFSLLTLIVLGVIVYKFHSKMRKWQFGLRRSQKKEDHSDARPDAFHHYTSMHRGQEVAQAPIYENLTRTAGYSRSPSEPDKDLYLQCDFADDAIYSNDPRCNLAILPDCHEEDVYITPDSQ